MRRRIWGTRLLQRLPLFVFVAPGFAGQAPAPQANEEEARVFKIIAARVQQYVKLPEDVEASLPALKPTQDEAQIVEHAHTWRTSR